MNLFSLLGLVENAVIGLVVASSLNSLSFNSESLVKNADSNIDCIGVNLMGLLFADIVVKLQWHN